MGRQIVQIEHLRESGDAAVLLVCDIPNGVQQPAQHPLGRVRGKLILLFPKKQCGAGDDILRVLLAE